MKRKKRNYKQSSKFRRRRFSINELSGNSTVAGILRSTVIGSQSVKGCEGFKPIILFIGCHVRSASFIIFARVEGVLVSSVARISSVARVSSISRVSAGGSSNCLRTLRDSCLVFPFLIMYSLHDGLVMGPIQITANINSKQLYKL